jgi:2-polyprenyl-3-methyl-5-hydroxy-6-metoxy-1,4-benzoquinol methylase
MSGEFDQYRASYRAEVQRSIDFIGQDVDMFTEAKARLVVDIAGRHLGATGGLRALDVGCGVGLTDAFLEGAFAELHGIDASAGSIEEASKANPWAKYHHYEGTALPVTDGSFDLCFAISVLHHVDPPDRPGFVREVRRVTRPGGLVVVFEHNSLNPLTRLAVSRCDFDEGVVLLARRTTESLLVRSSLRVVEGRYILFFPWKQEAFRRVERGLAWLPLGAQYVVAARNPQRP